MITSMKTTFFSKLALLFILLGPVLLFSENQDSLDNKYNQLPPGEFINTLNSLGKQAYRTQEYQKAEEYFKKALEMAVTNNNKLEMAKISNNIGIIEDTKGNYPDALEYYRNALTYYEQQADKDGIEKVLNNIGIVYEELKMYDNALNYFKRSLELKLERPKVNFLSSAGTYNNIAIIYANYLHQTDSALYYYRLALKNYEDAKYKNGKGKVCSNIGLLYFRKKKLNKAESCFKTAFIVFKELNNKGGIASVLFYQANLNIEREEPKKALLLLDKALEISRKLRVKTLEKDIVKAYAAAYEKMGESDSALVYYKMFQQINEELINSKKLDRVKNLEQQIKMDRKDYEINLLKKDREINKLKQNKQFILILTLLFILLSVTIIFYQVTRKRSIKSEMQLSRAKTRLLRTQMSPHFLFNSLMSIQTFLIEGDVKGASKYLTLLARLMRLLLTYSRESYISLEQEIEISDYYLATEKLRFGEKIDYQITVDPDIDKNNVFIPPLMIQPALENAIVHGLMPCNKNGKLLLIFKKSNNKLIVLIEDTGVGYKTVKTNLKDKRRSFSTGIIKERIELIKKQFRQHISYQIEEINPELANCPGTRVIFEFPLDY
jgi:tetratricopeptide (TPR) repeat protein